MRVRLCVCACDCVTVCGGLHLVGEVAALLLEADGADATLEAGQVAVHARADLRDVQRRPGRQHLPTAKEGREGVRAVSEREKAEMYREADGHTVGDRGHTAGLER